MEKLKFKIVINAPRKTVWNTMLNDATYREWTKAFHPGSYYEGSWEKGSSIHFVAREEDGTLSGMASKINENRPYEFISIQHLGEIVKGEEKPWDEADQEDSFENYTFKDVEGGTELTVEMNSPLEYKDMFDEMWPKALDRLKELCVQNSVRA